MDIQELTRQCHIRNDSKIVLFVADGLGGHPREPGGQTELEASRTPNLDRLARENVCGLLHPVAPGIAPGSGPGHLSLFGYDPVKHLIGRGALEATGIGFELQPGDVAVRCNFCTLNDQGLIVDRRAGRIATEQSGPLAESLNAIRIEGAEIFVQPVKEHRFVVVFRGQGLGAKIGDTDPQVTGQPPSPAVGQDAASQTTADIANEFVTQARQLLRDQPAANGLTMRGFAGRPDLPSYEQVYGLKAAAIAVYPMYKGLAQLAGMQIVGQPANLNEQLELLRSHWDDFDFFFLHFKYTDSTGEDGDFEGRIQQIETMDAAIGPIEALGPSVLIVTGDHSTPAYLGAHSWHPVPTLLVSDCCRPDTCQTFGETEAIRGGLGQFQGKYLMSLALANARRLSKFGA